MCGPLVLHRVYKGYTRAPFEGPNIKGPSNYPKKAAPMQGHHAMSDAVASMKGFTSGLVFARLCSCLRARRV